MPAEARGARPPTIGSRTSRRGRSVVPYDSQYSDTGIARDVPGPRVTVHRRVGGDGIDQLDDGLVDDGLGPTLEQRQAQNISIIGTVGHRYDVLQEQFLDLRIRFVEHRAQAVAVVRDGQAEEQSAYQRGIELIDAAGRADDERQLLLRESRACGAEK